MLMPFSGKKSDVGIGGMRLYNDVTPESRPAHFVDNWNYVLDHFAEDWRSGRIASQVKSANDEAS